MFPLYSLACSLPPRTLCVLLLSVPRPTAYSHRRWATAPHHRIGPLPRVPLPALMTATSPAAVRLVSRAEVRCLGYVHTHRHYPSSLLDGSEEHRSTTMSLPRGYGTAQYSHRIHSGARGQPLYIPELVSGSWNIPVFPLIFLQDQGRPQCLLSSSSPPFVTHL